MRCVSLPAHLINCETGTENRHNRCARVQRMEADRLAIDVDVVVVESAFREHAISGTRERLQTFA